MTHHTYAGHTLAEIREAAEKATPGPWDRHCGYLVRAIFGEYAAPVAEMRTPYRPGIDDVQANIEHDRNASHIATANPATVLAMAARIEELERSVSDYGASLAECRDVVYSPDDRFTNLCAQACGDPASVPDYVKEQFDKTKSRIEELGKDAARLSTIAELSSILREAAAILSGEAEMRYPIIDELEGFAAMLEEKPTTP